MSPGAVIGRSEPELGRATVLRVVLASGSVLALYFSLMAIAVWEGQAVYAVFLPLVVLILGLLGSSLVKLGSRGRYAEPLSRSMLAIGITASFLALVLEGQGVDPARLGATIALAIAALVLSIVFLVTSQGRRRLALRAVAILLVGLTGLLAGPLSNLGPIQALGPVVLASALIAAIVSLLPLLSASPSRILRIMAKSTESTSNVAGIGAIVFLVVSYATVIRPLVGSEFPEALSIVEWSMVIVAVAIAGWATFRYLKSVSGAIELADWKVLGNELKRDKAELGPASKGVAEFVEGGRKEGLVLLVASVLRENAIDAETSKSIIARIIDYQELQPKLVTIGSDRRRKERAIEARRAVVRDVLDRCAAATAAGPNSETRHGPSFTLEEGGNRVGDQ